MKCVPISTVRRLAGETGATKMMVILVDDEGSYAFTTYGQTKAKCGALRRWADENAIRVAAEMAEAR